MVIFDSSHHFSFFWPVEPNNLFLFQIYLKMQLISQIGHLQHWGLTPAAHLLKHYPFPSHPNRPLRMLVSGTTDIRHILKTLCDLNEHPPAQKPAIEIYFHETNKELLCRALLFLHILHESQLTISERIELFLDLYGNAMIKERNARYLHNLRQDLLNLIHDQKQVSTPLKHFVSLKLLKFEDRDDMSEMIQSWSMKVPLDMQKMRDNKLRYQFKQRYEYRNNLIDWDFNMLLQQCAPIIHFYHYRQWRLTGLAYEQRFSRYTEPNRTLASYAPGRKKEDKTTCMVRGYWGDMVFSPYIAIGTKCDYHQSDLLFKKANLKFIGHSIQVADYNMNYWLHRLEKQEKYTRVFRDYYRCDEQTKKTLEAKEEKKKKIKANKPDLKAIKEAQEEQEIKQPKEEQPEGTNLQDLLKKPKRQKKQPTQQVLDSDEQQQKKRVDLYNANQINYKPQQKQILSGFRSFNVSLHLMAMNSDKLTPIAKYKQFFDVVCLGFTHSAYLSKGVENIVRKGGLLLVEKATYLVPKKKEERKEINTRLRGLIEERGFVEAGEEADLFAYFREEKKE